MQIGAYGEAYIVDSGQRKRPLTAGVLRKAQRLGLCSGTALSGLATDVGITEQKVLIKSRQAADFM